MSDVVCQCGVNLCIFFCQICFWEIKQDRDKERKLQTNDQNYSQKRELQNRLLNDQKKQQKHAQKQIKKNEHVPTNTKPQVFLQVVEQLYEISLEQNEFPEQFQPFIGPPLSQKELIESFAKDNGKIEEELIGNLNGYHIIRMDGNSFYSAFTYQYLEFVLNYQSKSYFEGFIAHMRKMNFQMKFHSNFSIPQEYQNLLAKYYADQLIYLKKYPQDLFKLFSDPGNLFFGLSILFIRNLVNYIYFWSKTVQKIDNSMSDNFLFWEKESEINEVLMTLLANELKLQIHCYYVDSEKKQFKHDLYYEQGVYSIHLIQQSQHFQIGIPIAKNK